MFQQMDLPAPKLLAPKASYGPVAWCKFCSRRHPRRKHDLELVERIAKSGRKVMRWAHVPSKPKPKRRARRS